MSEQSAAQLEAKPAGGRDERSSVMPVTRLRPSAILPAYQTEDAAGMDLCACPEDGAPITIEPITRAGATTATSIIAIHTGIAVAIPRGFEGQVRPRSGLARKFGITLPNAPGTIDADYRGEIIVPLINLGHEPFTIEPGMRIAQMVIAPVLQVRIEEVPALDETARGVGGFGSTGV